MSPVLATASVAAGATGRNSASMAPREDAAGGEQFSKALQASSDAGGNNAHGVAKPPATETTAQASANHAAERPAKSTTPGPANQRAQAKDADAASDDENSIEIEPALPWWLPAATLPAAHPLTGAGTAADTASATALPAAALATGIDAALISGAKAVTPSTLATLATTAGSTSAAASNNATEKPAALTPLTALPAPAAVIAMPIDGQMLTQGFKALLEQWRTGADASPATPAPFAISSASQANLLASTATVNPAQLPTPHLHSEHFGEAIGTQLSWLAEQKIGHAHIRIAPHDLGPLEVQLALDGDRVRAEFSSAQPEVRQALESSLPRLREMLGQHGFHLAHADVSQGRHGGNPPGHGTGNTAPSQGDGLLTTDASAAVETRVISSRLLDAYA